MEQLLTYGVVGAIVIAIAWIGIKAALSEARRAGSAEERAAAQAKAREAEAEMGLASGEVITTEDLKDRIKQGTFGGQKP